MPGGDVEEIDAKTLSLAQLAALAAVGGSVSAYCELVDSAISAGASPSETVDLLANLSGIVGWPCVVKAAPSLAMALGYDIEEAMEDSGGRKPDYPPSNPTRVA